MDNKEAALDKFVGFVESMKRGDTSKFLIAQNVESMGPEAFRSFDAQQAIAIAKAICAVMTPVCKMLNDNTLIESDMQAAIERTGATKVIASSEDETPAAEE